MNRRRLRDQFVYPIAMALIIVTFIVGMVVLVVD